MAMFVNEILTKFVATRARPAMLPAKNVEELLKTSGFGGTDRETGNAGDLGGISHG